MTNHRKQHQILVIDDDEFSINIIESALEKYRIISDNSGKILSHIDLSNYDLVILDIDLNGNSGFSLCEEIRKYNTDIPVLFISSMSDLESRLSAYGVGGNDYIAKPFLNEELQYKASSLIRFYKQLKELNLNLYNNTRLVLDVQKEAANLQEINRFIISSHQCKDIESLYIVFFHTLKALDTDGVLAITNYDLKASNGEVSRLEKEILEMANRLPRIYSFGKGRAFYNWKNCQLLVRKIGSLIDTLAILMDSLEICIDNLNHQKSLIDQISILEDHAQESKNMISSLFDKMTQDLSDELQTLGLISSLDPDEEERVRNLLFNYSNNIQRQLLEQEKHNNTLKSTIEKMSTNTLEFSKYLEWANSITDDSDAIELF